MNVIRVYQRSLIVVVALFLPVVSVSAQIEDAGRLERWTKTLTARRHAWSGVSNVRRVRAGKQKTFDRVLFEFTGSLPNYRVEYLKSHFFSGEEERIRITSPEMHFCKLSF